MGIFFGFYICLCARSRKVFLKFKKKMKNSHSHCKKVQKTLLHSRRYYYTTESFTTQLKALLHNRRFYCTAESFIAQHKVLLRNRRFYCTVESFTAQQKSQSCGKNQRKVPSAAETEDKPNLQRLPLDLDSTFAHKLAVAEWYFGAHSAKRQAQLPSQKKPRLSVVQ